jgi:hypothetical protein
VLKLNKLDKYISDIVSKNITESSEYENAIRNALKENKKKEKNMYELFKKIAIVIVSLSTIGGVVFAKYISEKNEYISNNNTLGNMNEYIQTLDNEYETIDNLSIKIDSILVDEFNIQLNIEYLYTETITSAESKILIKDENNNIIFNNNVVNYMNYVFGKEDRRSYQESLIYGKNIAQDEEYEQDKSFTKGYKSVYQNIKNNNIIRTLSLYTDIDEDNFPKSKIFYIQLEDITLKNNSNIVKTISDKWNFEIKLDEKFLNRNIISYKQKEIESNKQEFKVIQAELSNVQFKLKIEYTGKENLTQLIDTLDLSNVQIYDKKNDYYIKSATLESVDNEIIKVGFDVNRSMLSDDLQVVINNDNKIEILKDCIIDN